MDAEGILILLVVGVPIYGFFWWLSKKNPKGDFSERHWESDR